MIDPTKIRNFAIVAHIDHGKSTLADRLLEQTHTINQRLMREQILDSNPIERERGITIKLAPVRMNYKYQDKEYILNLIDTPGHVDFSYEVSRSLAACEGIILLVDATTGIQAQTLAHFNLIKEHNLKIIPVINKIDLPTADIPRVKKQMVDNFNLKSDEIIEISAKKNINIEKVLRAIIDKIPSPEYKTENLRGLVFSSQYHPHLGVIIYIRLIDGEIAIDSKSNQSIQLQFLASRAVFKPLEIGIFTPEMKKIDHLGYGEVGYIATGLKNIKLAQVGDTVGRRDDKISPLKGFKKPKPFVFLCLYPVDNNDYLQLRNSLEKLQLTDSSISIKPHSSPALGKGFLGGFLGLLHADISKERLYREFDLDIITTVPSVEYQVTLKSGETINVRSADEYPDPSQIKLLKEPLMLCNIFTPVEYVGSIMQLVSEKRGIFRDLKYFGNQAQLIYLIPLAEMIVDFFDKLKSLSSGFASLDYDYFMHSEVDAVKLDILINHHQVDAFSQIVVRENANIWAKIITSKLKKLIPKHLFQIAIQAAVGGKIIAREDIPALRKDVTAKLYGGDRTRKDKLLKIQKKGKKKMKQFGNVEIPQEVFINVFRTNP